jgi:uncharacterized protein (DUF3820 family)
VNSFLESETIFKRECETPDGAIFTTTEQKLLRLGLNSAAHPGESDNCAIMLFRSLRRRGVDAEQIIASYAQQIWAMRELSAARGRVMTFGKHQGKTIDEIPRHYLMWALENCDNMPLNLRRAIQIVLKEGSKK